MPQTATFSGAKMYDIFDVDGPQKIGDALDDEMGTKVGSNVRIFDGLFQSQNNQIVSLQSQLAQLIQDNYTIYYVELTKDTTVTTSSSYAGNNNKFTALKEDYIYLLKFDSNNVGNIQININASGFVNAIKISNGTPTAFQDDDIVASVPYLFLYKSGQFVFVGENNVQKLKELDTDIETLQEDIATTNTNLMAEITARDPRNKDTDAFLASNHDMTGFSVPITYTPVTGSDTSLSAFEKIAAQQNQQDTEITTLEQRVDSLYGAVVYLGTVEEHTVDVTQTILTDKAESILTDRGISTDLKQGYTLVDLDLNDWWYDETDLLWINIGYSAVGTATNTTKGIVMGDTTDGKVSINSDGTMTSNGTMLKTEYAPEATAATDGTVLAIISDNAHPQTDYDVRFVMPDGPFSQVSIDGEDMTGIYDLSGEETEIGAIAGVPVTLTRQGDRAFFKQGGGGLNYKVAGGSTRPTTGLRENLIWVNTTVDIAGYYFYPVAPSAYLGPGGVWIKTTGVVSDSAVTFNAIKSGVVGGTTTPKNSILIVATGIYQSIGGVWKPMEAYIYQSGAWKQFIDVLPLYSEGTQDVPWISSIRGDAWMAGVTFGTNSIDLSLASVVNAEASVVTSSKINVTGYNYLRFNTAQIGYTTFNAFGLRDTNSGFNTTNGWTIYARQVAAGDLVIDISGISGEYYVAASNWNNGNVGATSPLSLTKAWLTLE